MHDDVNPNHTPWKLSDGRCVMLNADGHYVGIARNSEIAQFIVNAVNAMPVAEQEHQCDGPDCCGTEAYDRAIDRQMEREP